MVCRYDAESSNLPEHCGMVGHCMRGNWVVLRAVGADVCGGLTAVEMVKYTAK